MNLWSSRLAFYLGTVGASVGLGSIWRFPYLAGTGGGFAFVLAFIVACLGIATPLLVAELMIGRWARRNAPEAAGAIATAVGGSRAWNALGWLGTLAAFLIASYYTMIAGWVLAYTWKCLSGQLVGLSHGAVSDQFHSFVSDSTSVSAWQLAFIAIVGAISARGVNRGIEVANKIRAPALLILLLVLVGYALATGDVARGLAFAFAPDFSRLTPAVWLSAVGQAFYATGVGLAMMIAYGAYVPRDVPPLRSALIITGSIVLVSLLATLMVFPLVFRYGMDPAQGPALVFEVLPAAFAEMPGGRLVGTLFFLLLSFAALTPSIACFEPVVAWLQERHGLRRGFAVAATAASTWLLGFGSVLSFGAWSNWRPLSALRFFARMNFFEAVDFISSNLLLPVGALITCAFVGWRLARRIPREMLDPMPPAARQAVLFAVRYVCPLAIAAVLVSGLR